MVDRARNLRIPRRRRMTGDMAQGEGDTKQVQLEDEPDDWYADSEGAIRSRSNVLHHRDKRIFSTGCAGVYPKPSSFSSSGHNIDGVRISAEQTKMNDCYFEKRDWRACSKEVSC